jgi:hypothetical protein
MRNVSFIQDVLGRIITGMKEMERERGFDMRKIIGGCKFFVDLFSEWFDKSEMKLEDLPQSEKQELWEQSKVYCEGDRVRFCKAIQFYKTF